MKSTNRNVTRVDVARRAGVSVATVSYVLNDGPRGVSAETKARVLEAVEELGYFPSEVARSLRTSRTLTIGLIVTDIVNPFHAMVARGVEEEARRSGYTVIQCNSDEDRGQELTYLRVLQSKRVDGIILVPTGGNVAYISQMIEDGWPIVQVDRKLEGLQTDSVVMDNVHGAYEAVTHLIKLGHRRIALVGAPTALTPGQERRQGYEKALHEAGIPVDTSLICESNYKGEDTLELVGDFWDSSTQVSAVFAATNMLAFKVMAALKRRGLSIPNDVSLCVFDDPAYYELLSPSITAVRCDIPALARQAFELLVERMYERGPESDPVHVVMPCELMVRESTQEVHDALAH